MHVGIERMEAIANITLLHQGIEANLEPDTTRTLNILISTNHCVGTVFDKSRQKFVILKSFHSTEGSDIFSDAAWLKENFPWLNEMAVTFSISFPKTILVPDALYNENLNRDFLQLNYQVEPRENIFSSFLTNLNANLVYADDTNVAAKLKAAFPNCSINHACAGWLENISLLNKNEEESAMYIDIEGDKIDIAYFSEGSLQLFNSFACQADEDKLYYPLFISEQLKINPGKNKYYISGFIEKDSTTYKIFSKYLKNLKFMESPAQFRFSLPVMTLPAHFYNKTFCTPLCA